MQSMSMEQLFLRTFILASEAISENPKYKSSVTRFDNLIDELKFRLPEEDYTLLDKALKAKSEMTDIQDYEIFTTALVFGMKLAEEKPDE